MARKTIKQSREDATDLVVDLIIEAGTRIRAARTPEEAEAAFTSLEDRLVPPLGVLHPQAVTRLMAHFRSQAVPPPAPSTLPPVDGCGAEDEVEVLEALAELNSDTQDLHDIAVANSGGPHVG